MLPSLLSLIWPALSCRKGVCCFSNPRVKVLCRCRLGDAFPPSSPHTHTTLIWCTFTFPMLVLVLTGLHSFACSFDFRFCGRPNDKNQICYSRLYATMPCDSLMSVGYLHRHRDVWDLHLVVLHQAFKILINLKQM